MKIRLTVIVAALLALLCIKIAGLIFHIWIVPPRFLVRHLGMAIPLILCLFVGILIRSHLWRAIFGIAQAVLLLHIFSNFYERELAFGDVWVVYGIWLMWITAYTALFMLLTCFLGARIKLGTEGGRERKGAGFT